MIETLHFGFTDITNEKIYKLELSEDEKAKLGFNSKNEKTIWDYYDSYLIDKRIKDKLQEKFEEYINKTLPKELKESCLWCNGKSKNENDKKCTNYKLEGSMNLFFATWWYVNLVENNKHLLSDKKLLNDLSINFYECFLFKDGRVFFNLKKLTMFCLEKGFITLSILFAKNDKIQNLEIINQAIDKLDSEYLSITMFDKGKPYHIKPQKKFFKNKRETIKEQLEVERLKKEQNQPQQTETVKNDEVKKELHNDYFKDNAFEIWELLFENFNIDKTKRTDLRFMYEIMKHNGQIHKTITVKNITDWINETYDFGIDKLQYTSIKSKSNENRMSIYKLIK